MGIQLPIMDGHEVTRRIKANPAMRSVPWRSISHKALACFALLAWELPAGDCARAVRVPARADQFALLFVLGPVNLALGETLSKDIECTPPVLTTAGRPIHHSNENDNETYKGEHGEDRTSYYHAANSDLRRSGCV